MAYVSGVHKIPLCGGLSWYLGRYPSFNNLFDFSVDTLYEVGIIDTIKLGTFTGSSLPCNGNFESSGNELLIRFISDYAVVKPGFSMSYNIIEQAGEQYIFRIFFLFTLLIFNF